MTQLFNRNFQVIISDATKEIMLPANPIKQKVMAKFEIVSASSSSQPTDSFVELYNLNDNDLNFIASRAKKIEILAGYDDAISIIYAGQIDKVEISKKKQDKKTRIAIVPDTYNINNSNYKISYVGSKSINEIITAAVTSINLPTNGLNLIPTDQTLKNYAFMGQTKVLLTKLLTPLNLDWFIDQGYLQITQKGKANQQTIPVVSKDTGMIGSPTLTTDGINVDSLLNQNIVVGGSVQIKSDAVIVSSTGRETNNLKQAYNGIFKVVTVKHHGATLDGVFQTSFICKELTDVKS